MCLTANFALRSQIAFTLTTSDGEAATEVCPGGSYEILVSRASLIIIHVPMPATWFLSSLLPFEFACFQFQVNESPLLRRSANAWIQWSLATCLMPPHPPTHSFAGDLPSIPLRPPHAELRSD